MADYLVDLTLATGTDSGVAANGWANAKQGIAGFATLAATLSGGDRVFVKNNITTIGADRVLNFPEAHDNPVLVYAVKAATTATTTIAQSDLIPGESTGDATRAYDQTAGNAPVNIQDTNSGRDLSLDGASKWYGFLINIGGHFRCRSTSKVGSHHFLECRISPGSSNVAGKGMGTGTTEACDIFLIKCAINLGTDDTNCIKAIIGTRVRLFDCISEGDAGTPIINASAVDEGMCSVLIDGCDFSNQTSRLIDVAYSSSIPILIRNTSMGSGCVIASGTNAAQYRVEAHNVGVNPGTPYGSGDTDQEQELHTERGDCVLETTAVRTGGANDGKTGLFGWALTPNVDTTVEGLWPCESMELHGWVAGDGTSKTATIYIANDGGSDLNNDDVSVRLLYPSESGEVKHEYVDTVVGLLGTPDAVTNPVDDTGSTWGGTAANPQKFDISIAPDYSGPIYAVVQFHKRFAASPATLFIDPVIYVV